MRTRTTVVLAGAAGLLAIGLVWGWGVTARPHPAATGHPVPTRRPGRPHPPSGPHPKRTTKPGPAAPQLPVPTLPGPGAAPGAATAAGATAAFAAVTHTVPPLPVAVVPSPATPGRWWAVEPMGVTTPGLSAPTLWSADRSRTGRWRWTPVTWPGRITGLPPALADALQWADALHAGRPGPQLLGPVPWASVAGQVGPPAGWTLAPLSAQDSPLGQPSVLLTVWLPSERYPALYYGLETVWDRQNAFSGQDALWMIQPAPGSRRQVLQRAESAP